MTKPKRRPAFSNGGRVPRPADIIAARARAGHTRAQLAAFVYVSPRTVEAWEQGAKPMPPGLFELYEIKNRIEVGEYGHRSVESLLEGLARVPPAR